MAADHRKRIRQLDCDGKWEDALSGWPVEFKGAFSCTPDRTSFDDSTEVLNLTTVSYIIEEVVVVEMIWNIFPEAAFCTEMLSDGNWQVCLSEQLHVCVYVRVRACVRERDSPFESR